MSRNLVQEIVSLYAAGWRAFSGTVDKAVYAALPCGRQPGTVSQAALTEVPAPAGDSPRKKLTKKPEPSWFFCGDAYVCLGCVHRCALTRPHGFQLHLELRYNTQQKYTLTPQEMVHKLNQLTVEQTAYCLNISRNQVYHWIREGKLPRSKTEMVRIPVAAVRELLQERED